jgi:type IV pilus assembly protein PilY1
MKRLSKLSSALVGIVAVLAAPAYADDSEVFTNSSFLASGVRPNVLFIVDTSGSMETEVENVYDPAKTYDGACDAGKVYWRAENTGNLVPPACDGANTKWVSVDNNRCRAAATRMSTKGWWNGRTAMLTKTGNPLLWGNAVAGQDWKLECQSDDKIHGDLPGTTAAGAEAKRAKNGTGTIESAYWTDGTKSLFSWNGAQNVSLFSANYINWYTSTDAGVTKTRLSIVKDVATDLIRDLNGVNLGIMRYSADAEGGMVMYPVSELTTDSRKAMTDIVNNFIAEGNTPLSETMYEAYSYLANKELEFGDDSQVVDHYDKVWNSWLNRYIDVPVLGLEPSVKESKTPKTEESTTYDGPMDFSCQTTYVVYLTDGLPTEDNDADEEIEALTGEKCPDKIPNPDKNWPTSGRCFQTLTGYMYNNDLRTDVVGDQKVITYVIGFGSSIASSKDYLESVAKAGGGQAYTQSDAAGLASTLEDIFLKVQEAADTTFVAPSVSVNAFNRSQNLNELFISVFAPSKNTHWPGNLKKYRIYNNDIYGIGTSAPAVDSKTGFFAEKSQALNSKDIQDGPKAALGGAANSLPAPDSRKMYTYLGGTDKDLTVADNAFHDDNKKITYDMVDAADDVERTRVINYARGADLRDEDKDDNRSEASLRMGDPMHARPAILVHGGSEAEPDGTVFVPTNDGVLHAFDMASVGTSTTVTVRETTERWAFIPQEFLKRQGLLYDDGPLAARDYALDGDVRVFKYDVNQNGVIDTADGDKAYIFFGTGRGGSTYYALDVTLINKPKFLWKIDNTMEGFNKLAKTWSAPQIARVQIGATGAGQNAQKFVLIFGGGYATANDDEPNPFAFSEDTVGNEIFMVDLESGALLWRGGKSGTGLNFTNANMTHSFPGNITVMDTDGDRFADRMYAADMGGQVWRFDIWNKNDVGELVTGGVIASLGNKGVETPTPEHNRRFYYAPDVAPFTMRGSHPFMNIALGSGYRGHPLSGGETDESHRTHDRFYSIRDYQPFNKRTQKSYDDAEVILDSDEALVDVTKTVDAKIDDTKLGWKLMLNYPEWAGEKVLAEATTAGGVIFFPTFTPMTADPDDPCLARSMNRLYGVYAANAAPFVHWADGSTTDLTVGDRYTELNQKGIAPALSILSNPTGTDGMGICQVGAQILNRCVKIKDAVRSYWELK